MVEQVVPESKQGLASIREIRDGTRVSGNEHAWGGKYSIGIQVESKETPDAYPSHIPHMAVTTLA